MVSRQVTMGDGVKMGREMGKHKQRLNHTRRPELAPSPTHAAHGIYRRNENGEGTTRHGMTRLSKLPAGVPAWPGGRYARPRAWSAQSWGRGLEPGMSSGQPSRGAARRGRGLASGLPANECMEHSSQLSRPFDPPHALPTSAYNRARCKQSARTLGDR